MNKKQLSFLKRLQTEIVELKRINEQTEPSSRLKVSMQKLEGWSEQLAQKHLIQTNRMQVLTIAKNEVRAELNKLVIKISSGLIAVFGQENMVIEMKEARGCKKAIGRKREMEVYPTATLLVRLARKYSDWLEDTGIQPTTTDQLEELATRYSQLISSTEIKLGERIRATAEIEKLTNQARKELTCVTNPLKRVTRFTEST